LSGNVAAFQVLRYRAFAGRVNVRRSLPQPVTLVNADDDTVDGPTRGFACGREIIHKESLFLLAGR
jgi:hypothetical protein